MNSSTCEVAEMTSWEIAVSLPLASTMASARFMTAEREPDAVPASAGARLPSITSTEASSRGMLVGKVSRP